ncbi:hypothetical protein QFZ30_002451 [Arthrobacter pascens]|uniref:hypothetical protein n=1 Tax=Arthrobacter pascens TaxID=1677 RepID=UPI002793F654|nr:hypothetical protein [Arthrobacter pascens]MDQ0679069.1 hypothetical protein [Arthrobacter pascens]
MTAATPQPIYKAGLTKWAMPFDRSAGARAPQVPDDPGPIHAVRPLRTELGIREPYFIEDTYNYRAALCGAKVKIIMPNTFKPEEDKACAYCIAESRNPTRKVLMRPGGGPAYNSGDRWSPGRWLRKRKQRN